MTKNKLLNIAIIICKLSKGFFIFSFIIVTTVFIYFQIDKELVVNKLEDSKISINLEPNHDFAGVSSSTKWKITKTDEDEKVYAFKNIRTASLYILYLQYVGILFFLFLTTREFQKVMLSVRNLETFKKENVLSFKRIGKYIFAFYILISCSSVEFKEGGYSWFHWSVTPLFFILFAFIMAEIFKEGNVLEEENDLTI